MNKLQKVELDILKEVIKIIDKHNLKYYILGGTLLGAVRHKGFIPWDDDIDIGLYREDYEKFIKLAKKELPKHLILNYYKDHKNEPEYTTYYMIRVENSDVQLINRNANKEQLVNAWIDIFPIDGLPKNKIKSFFHKAHLLVLRAELRFSQYSKLVTKDAKSKDFITRSLIFVGKFINTEKIFKKDKVLDKLDKTLKKCSVKDAKEIINFAGACKAYKFIEIFPKTVYDSLENYEFEDAKLVGPRDYDFILTRQYGSYMELPPENMRNKHKTEIIERKEK